MFGCVGATLTSPTVPSTTISSATVSSATVGSNPFAVGGVYPAMTQVPASPQYMLVQTGSGPCYVPVTYAAFGTAVMSPQPPFSPPAAAPFQLLSPQQQAPFAVPSQMHPANPFLVINSSAVCGIVNICNVWFHVELVDVSVADE